MYILTTDRPVIWKNFEWRYLRNRSSYFMFGSTGSTGRVFGICGSNGAISGLFE